MVVTPAEGRIDPAVQLTTLPGWRHFVAGLPSIPDLFTRAGWLGLGADKRGAHACVRHNSGCLEGPAG